MRVAVDASSLGLGGGRVHLANVLEWMAAANPGVRFAVYSRRQVASVLETLPDNVVFRMIPDEYFSSIVPRLFWEHLIFPVQAQRLGASVALYLGVSSVLAPSYLGVPSVPVVQNMLALHPQALRWYRGSLSKQARLLYLKSLTRHSCKRATHIIAVSETTRQAILQANRIAPERVTTVLHGVDHDRFRPLPRQDVRSVCRSMGLSSGYLLSVSSIYRYKNYLNLIRAYHLLLQQSITNAPLVIVGSVEETGYYQQILQEIERLGLRDVVVILRHVEQTKLPYLYSGASVYVFPSICEVFGLTLVEAMACGVPVVTSKVSAMPEICGDTALYFDPYDPEDIAKVVADVLLDPNLADELSRRGLTRAQIFSWERTARQTFEVLARVGRV